MVKLLNDDCMKVFLETTLDNAVFFPILKLYVKTDTATNFTKCVEMHKSLIKFIPFLLIPQFIRSQTKTEEQQKMLTLQLF
jgi:hypothetical protein